MGFYIVSAHLIKLTNLLNETFYGCYNCNIAVNFRDVICNSISSVCQLNLLNLNIL